MSNISKVRNDVKHLAQAIESLAHEVQLKIDQGGDVLALANELVRNSSTFVFSLGEMWATEQSGKKVKTTVVKNPSNTNQNYHNLRDALGRFTKV